jgi:hypothetical protein
MGVETEGSTFKRLGNQLALVILNCEHIHDVLRISAREGIQTHGFDMAITIQDVRASVMSLNQILGWARS